MKLLVLGSKEYPLGTGDDPIKSGGIEVYTQNLVKRLEGKVAGIAVITRKFSSTRTYEEQGSIEVYRVPWMRGFYLRNPTFNFSAFIRALTLDFDVILSQGPVSSFLGGLLALVRKKRLVARPAGIAYVQPQYRRFARRSILLLEKAAYRRADVVVFLSSAEKEQFKKKMGYLPRRYVIIPTGVEVSEVPEREIKRTKEALGIGEGAAIAFVGRLIGVKGGEILIQAVRELKGDFKAVIVGDGPDRGKLESMVEGYGLKDRVVFTGWRSDVPQILAASDIFVLPSYSEGLPIALLEAMASGKACVVTDIGLPVEHGEDALVVKAGDALELGARLQELLNDTELMKKLGEEARRKVTREFSWEKAVADYLRLFGELAPEPLSP